MKQYLLVTLIVFLFSGTASAQTLRTCGCKTWMEWKKAEGATRESRREKRKKYGAYRDQCLIECKGKEGEPKKEKPNNGTQ